MLTGTVFNIQKFSLHDGPGIRTVVFFKGCPLRCAWCSNPESQSRNAQVLWDENKCLCCGACAAHCKAGAAVQTASGIRIDESACTGCGACVRACPGRALSLEGGEKTVDEVLRECLQDRDFYEESRGGVTLSGGEALLQPDFAIALLKELKREGVHNAIETTGAVSPAVFREALPHLDLLLFDVKHWDEERHRAGTGASNRLPLENLREAIVAGKSVLPRLPVIPGYNDSLEDAAGFAELLRKAGAKEAQLLPFHQFGERKYELLGRNYAYKDVPALREKELSAFRQVFLDNGIRAFF